MQLLKVSVLAAVLASGVQAVTHPYTEILIDFWSIGPNGGTVRSTSEVEDLLEIVSDAWWANNDLNRPFFGPSSGSSFVNFVLNSNNAVSPTDEGCNSDTLIYPWSDCAFDLAAYAKAYNGATAGDKNRIVIIQGDLKSPNDIVVGGSAMSNIFGVPYANEAIYLANPSHWNGNSGKEAVTLMHEIGHMFGLLHPFSDDCSNSDGIADTPVWDVGCVGAGGDSGSWSSSQSWHDALTEPVGGGNSWSWSWSMAGSGCQSPTCSASVDNGCGGTADGRNFMGYSAYTCADLSSVAITSDQLYAAEDIVADREPTISWTECTSGSDYYSCTF